jgi:hypothetical protein
MGAGQSLPHARRCRFGASGVFEQGRCGGRVAAVGFAEPPGVRSGGGGSGCSLIPSILPIPSILLAPPGRTRE